MTRLHRQRHVRETGRWFPVTAGRAVNDRDDAAAARRVACVRTHGMRPDDPRQVAARTRRATRSGLTETGIARAVRAEEG